MMIPRYIWPTLLLLCTPLSWGFSALISPPRVEGQQQAGKTYRNVLEITNSSDMAEKYTFKTADWSLDPQGGVLFQDTLAAGSCRPWVSIQAREITLKANQRLRYRFEVKVPADAPAGECRFAIMVEGEPQTPKGGIGLPVSGQIGVIVYLAIGDAKADITFVQAQTQAPQPKQPPLPSLTFHNQGLAHARLSGLIEGVDAKQQRVVFNPASDPILPQTSRSILLYPLAEKDQPPPQIAYPLSLKGVVENEKQEIPIDIVIEHKTTP